MANDEIGISVVEPKPIFDFSQLSGIYHTYQTGIYGLINASRQRAYVGATKQMFRLRWDRHRYELESGTHKNVNLQKDWVYDGPEAFDFVVLQELPRSHAMQMYEKFWIDGFTERGVWCYNSAWPFEVPLAPPPSVPLPIDINLLNVEEISAYLRVTPQTIFRLIERNELKAIRLGRNRNSALRVYRHDLEAFLATLPGATPQPLAGRDRAEGLSCHPN